MCHAGHIIIVREVAHVDVTGRAGFIGIGVMNKQGLQLVRESYDAVRTIVKERFLERIGQAVDLRHDGSSLEDSERGMGSGSESKALRAPGGK